MKFFALNFFFVFAAFFITSVPAWSQTNSQNTFVSAVDQDLNIRTVVITPTTDNTKGIYSKHIDAYLRDLVNEDKQWSLIEYPASVAVKFESLDEHPEDVQKILKGAPVDSVLSARLIKGPRGISITLTYFVGREGLPLLQESVTDYQGFDLNDVRSEVKRLFDQIKAKMPFRGVVLSRRAQNVTINLGSAYGLKPGMNVSIVQILKINRHPKLKFAVSNEKEVLGRVTLTKVEPYLSFGQIVMEKESGVIAVGAKVLPEEYIKYAPPAISGSGKVLQDLSQRGDSDVAFGDSPQEWKPEAPPQFGMIAILGGLSNYVQNAKLDSAGSLTGSNSLAPNIAVRGEIWLNSEWYMGLWLRQSVFSISTPDGASPDRSNMSVGQYGVNVGYNFLMSNDFFGPKFQLTAGYLNTNFNVDESTPLTFTSMRYGGLVLGVGAQFPVSDQIPLDIGAKFDFFATSSMTENISSGSSSNTINMFSFYGDYRLRPKFKIRGELMFEYYASSFSGSGERTDPASDASHKMITLFGGAEWLF
jgi:hypothetical protein